MDGLGGTVLGVALATVAGLVVNLVWFSPKGFFLHWWRALGKGDEVPGPETASSMAPTFAMVTAALVVQSLVLAWLLGLVAPSGATVASGALVGLVAGVGIAASSSLGHRLFSGQGLTVWAIEVGGDVASLVAMGAVLGLVV